MEYIMTENYVVRNATKLAFPANHKAFFTNPESLNPVLVFFIMRACVFLSHNLQMAKAPTTSKEVYDLSRSMVHRSILSLPFYKEIVQRAVWLDGLCEKFYKVVVPQTLYQDAKVTPSVRSCLLLADGLAYAETLTAEVGAILYDLSQEDIGDKFSLSDAALAEVSCTYFAFLDYALADFKKALLEEAPRLVAYPFEIPAVKIEAADFGGNALFDTYDFEEAPYDGTEIVSTCYLPTIQLYMVWDALYERFERLVWQDNVFTPLGETTLQSEEFFPEDYGEAPIETINAQYFKMKIDLYVKMSTEERRLPMNEFLKAQEAKALDTLLSELLEGEDSFALGSEGFTDADWAQAMDDEDVDENA